MKKIAAFFASVWLAIVYLAGFGTIGVSDGYELIAKQRLDPAVAMFSAQGICCDGEHFYCSGALTGVGFTGLAKYDLNMKCKRLKSGAVPKEFTKKYGSDHIGGIDCAGGYIYAPVEGEGDLYNFILLYDCETLEYTGKYYEMTCERLTDGIPWCAVDREGGFLYTSAFDPVEEILQYDLDTMEFIKAIPLETEVRRIQGGSVWDGALYLSYDCIDPGTRETIYRVDPADGSVEVELVRELPNYDNEAEDVCVYPLPDGSFIHTVDYDKLIFANVMHFGKSG